jgi:hypothetical protein
MSHEPPVFKLTIYVTPTQWDRMSHWSATQLDQGDQNRPWLHLQHEVGKYQEYQQCLLQHHERLHPHNVEVKGITRQ